MQLCIWAIIIGAVIAILRLVVPYAFAQLGGGGMIVSIINIVLWAFVACVVIYVAFSLISCLVGMGGGTLLPHR
jgi:hypothetical protein